MSKDELRRACLHEAGHSLLALKLGVRLKSVRANADGTGSAVPEDADSEDPRHILRVARAGVSAEQLEFPDARWDINSNDGVIAYKALLKLDNHQHEEDAAVEEVEETLRELREQLEELARFLCDQPNRLVPWADIKKHWDATRP